MITVIIKIGQGVHHFYFYGEDDMLQFLRLNPHVQLLGYGRLTSFRKNGRDYTVNTDMYREN